MLVVLIAALVVVVLLSKALLPKLSRRTHAWSALVALGVSFSHAHLVDSAPQTRDRIVLIVLTTVAGLLCGTFVIRKDASS